MELEFNSDGVKGVAKMIEEAEGISELKFLWENANKMRVWLAEKK